MLIMFASCQHKSVGTQDTATALPLDSCMLCVIQAIGDLNQNLVDIKGEINQLIDTMQKHAEFHPDAKIRIGARSFAATLSQRILMEEENHQENMATLDSLFMRLID